MTLPFLYPIVDITEGAAESGSAAGMNFLKRLLALPIAIVQIRAKNLPFDLIASLVQEARSLRDALNPRCRLIVNDFPKAALNAEADGVHLGQDDCSPDEARMVLGPNATIGLSTHDLEQVRRAPFDLLDYIGFGPVFPSRTKSGHAAETGLMLLQEASALSPLPVVAIGGMSSERAADVYATGAASIAVISDLQRSENLSEKFQRYQQAFESCGFGW